MKDCKAVMMEAFTWEANEVDGFEWSVEELQIMWMQMMMIAHTRVTRVPCRELPELHVDYSDPYVQDGKSS